jgi:type IV pilus assembly protein PilP
VTRVGSHTRARSWPRWSLMLSVLGLLLAATACGDDPAPASGAAGASSSGGKAGAGASKSKSAKTKEQAPVASVVASAEMPPLPKVDFQEEDFAENERSRDPFRAYQDLFVEKADRRSLQRAKVLLEEYSLDELKLIGVISRIVPAKAMIVDPGGKGHVIERNDLVGRAERVQAGSSNDEFEINWRVDRIRESDVVFVREDPANPDVPSATRVLSLRTAEEDSSE